MREKYVLDSFQVYMNRYTLLLGADKIIENIMVFIANFFYSFTKLLYELFSFVINLIYQIDILLSGSKTAFSFASSLYNELFNLLGVPIFLSVICYYLFEFFTGSIKKANRYLMMFITIFVINYGFYAKGAEIIENTQSVITTIETEIYSKVLFGDLESSENFVDKKLGDKFSDYLFNSLVADTFMTLNFGELTFDEEKAKDYLVLKGTENVDKEIKEREKAANRNNDEPYFQSTKGFEKIWIAVISIFKAVFVGGIFMIIGLFKLVIQMIVLSMIFFLPLLSILAMIPVFNGVIFKFLSQGLGLMFLAPVLSLSILILFWLFNTVDNGLKIIFESNMEKGVRQFFASVLFKIIFVLFMYRKRTALLSLLTTGNMVHSVAPLTNANILRYKDSNPYNDSYRDWQFQNLVKQLQTGLNFDKLLIAVDKLENSISRFDNSLSHDLPSKYDSDDKFNNQKGLQQQENNQSGSQKNLNTFKILNRELHSEQHQKREFMQVMEEIKKRHKEKKDK